VDIVFGQVLKYNLLSSTQETLLSSAAVKVFPNPASEQVNIEYELTREAPVTMGIYDLGGRLLASWNEGNMPSGKHLLTWNGTDAGGRTIQNGTYIFRLLAGNSLSAGLISWQKP
jgi:flagellar hook assembly protein FlgD